MVRGMIRPKYYEIMTNPIPPSYKKHPLNKTKPEGFLDREVPPSPNGPLSGMILQRPKACSTSWTSRRAAAGRTARWRPWATIAIPRSCRRWCAAETRRSIQGPPGRRSLRDPRAFKSPRANDKVYISGMLYIYIFNWLELYNSCN